MVLGMITAVVAPTVAQGDEGWTTRSPMPTSRLEMASAVLEGTVVSFVSAPTVLEGGTIDDPESSQASTYTVIVRAQVEFKDLVKNDVIWSNNNFQFRDDYEVGENPEEFFDQESLTLQRLGEEFAKSLVSSILEAF